MDDFPAEIIEMILKNLYHDQRLGMERVARIFRIISRDFDNKTFKKLDDIKREINNFTRVIRAVQFSNQFDKPITHGRTPYIILRRKKSLEDRVL